MNQKRVYMHYPKEFKEENIALVTEGYSISEAENSLGIRANQMYEWKAKIETTKQNNALSGDERSEYYTLVGGSTKLTSAEKLKIYRRIKKFLNHSRQSFGSREMMKNLREEGFNVGHCDEFIFKAYNWLGDKQSNDY